MSQEVNNTSEPVSNSLFQDIKSLIEESRRKVATSVNMTLTMLHWQIGSRINSEILKGKRAEYGKQILHTLSANLTTEFGKGFSEKSLRHMCRFTEVFPDQAIVSSLLRQLSWTHFLTVMYLEDPLKRDFYVEMCAMENWSTRLLKERIDSMLFERTALSKKPDELIELELKKLRSENQAEPNLILKDPYILDFLELNDRYLEKDLEDAILREMEQFLLELGAGFSFIARQKRIQIDDDDFYIDLLFYNRVLKRLIVIELKQRGFKAEYKGQMELYLRWLDRHEKQGGEESPLGIILCAGKKEEQIELLELDQSGIHVAEYLTVLPPKELLQRKLHEAITKSRLRLENREDAR